MNTTFAIIFIAASFCWFVIFSYIFILFIFDKLLPLVFFGAFYVPSQDAHIDTMIKLAKIRPGDKAVDLGAGDGRIVIALAKKGVEAHGYEINPMLVWKANQAIAKEGLKGKAFMHLGNFWNKSLTDFDIIVMYGISFAMKDLEEKIKKEAKPDMRIICNKFYFPTWTPTEKEETVFLYKKTL